MTKVVILGDTHFGVRSDSKHFTDFYRKFYTEVFFPYLKDNNIKEIYQLGDLFDRRKYVNFYTLSECRDYFFDVIQSLGITLHVLVGNHDIFWRESLSVNSPDLLLKDYNNIILHDKPTEVKVGCLTFDVIPWICKENEEACYNFISNSNNQYCMGHFEIAGFQMYKGIDSHDGISPEIFKKYNLVLSGHYHHRSRIGSIQYVGTPMEHTWADFEDARGFHILDTNTREMEFIQNPYTMFTKLYYDDTKEVVYNSADFENKHLKLIVVNKTDYYAFDQFVEKIYKANPLELKIIEDLSEFETTTPDDNDIDLEDTMTLLSQYVDGIETEANKDKIKTIMKTLYVEAQNWEAE